MTKLYSDKDLWDAFMQRRRILGVFFTVTGAYFAGFLAFLIYYIMLPYEDPNQGWVIGVTCALTALYIIFLFPFMGICFKRILQDAAFYIGRFEGIFCCALCRH